MIVMLMPNQVPRFWEAIKFVTKKVNVLADENKVVYFNRLLQQLLSNKAQCFIEFNEERKLTMLSITRMMADVLNGDKILYIDCLYAFEPSTLEQWIEGFKVMREFAKNTECKRLTFNTAFDNIVDLAKFAGFTLQYKSLSIEV